MTGVGVVAGPQTGTGGFNITLAHYRARVFGFCITYGATVVGGISLDF
ncbi:MAG: hypothetical protein HYX53_01020 [Chloroflexi bacterium]|nr:hypothetical protein [Chloroflexota bacterium]